MLERRSVRTVLFALAVLASVGTWATEPPDLLNYQGVLRDAGGAPLAGSFDMVFRFFDDPTAGTEILADQHVGAGAVAVSGGLFSAELGGGVIVPLAASSLAELFGEHAAVYMQIDVEGEALAPRIRVLSSGFALNSNSLDGRDSAEFLDTSSNQVKTGDLTLDGTAGGGDLVLTNGGSIFLDGSGVGPFGVGSELTAGPCVMRVETCSVQIKGAASNLEVAEGANLAISGGGDVLMDSGADLTADGGNVLLDGSIVTVTKKGGKGSLLVTAGADLAISGGGDLLMDSGANLTADGGDVLLDGSIVTVTRKGLKGGLMVTAGANLEISGGGDVLMDSGANLTADGGDVLLDGSNVRVTSKGGKGSLKVQGGANLEISGGGDMTMGAGSDLHVMSGGNVMLAGGGDLTVTGVGSDVLVSGGGKIDVSGGDINLRGVGAGLVLNSATTPNLSLRIGPTDTNEMSLTTPLSISNSTAGVPALVDITGELSIGGDGWGGGSQRALNLQQASLRLYTSASNTTPGFSLVPGSSTVDMILNDGLNVVGPGSIAVNTDLSIESGSDLKVRGPDSRIVLGNNSFVDKLVLWFEAQNHMELLADLLIENTLSEQDILIGASPGLGIDVRIGRGSLCLDNDGACIQPEGNNGRAKALAYDTGSSDLAEMYPSPEILEPGDVVVLDLAAAGQVRKARATDEDGILSVISTAPGVVLGVPTDEEIMALEAQGVLTADFGGLARVPGTYPVALAGRVPVKVSDEGGLVRPGDFLTSSSMPGVAMKARRPGLVLGQALQAWAGPGQGTVVAWIVPGASNQFARGVAEGGGDDGGGHAAGPAGVPSTQRDTLQRGASTLSPPLDAEGQIHAGSFRSDSAELAASVTVSEAVEPGDVLVVDSDAPGSMRRGHSIADPAVVGIVSGAPGLLLGAGGVRAADPIEGGTISTQPEAGVEIEIQQPLSAAIALSGIVPCKVDAGFGSIRVGDLLTTSPTPGHAMRAQSPLPGTVLAKALESLEVGTGVVRVLVMLR